VSPYITWCILIALILALAYYSTRVARASDEDGLRDTGMAIMQFGRAFPDEAIRNLHVTADGNVIFVRLHDNKAGFMRNNSSHFACYLIRPGRVRITPLASAKGFDAEFLDAPSQNGSFVFASEKEAAEVSLWLLDNYVSVADHTTSEADIINRDQASENNP
jgi:hypothetical protein